jgi:hypothetical protein
MGNLVISNRCNRGCPYCFAMHTMPGNRPQDMPLTDVVRIADHVIAAGGKQLSVLGGEPTLHPHCVEICFYLLHRSLQVALLTNGIADAATIAGLRAIPAGAPFEVMVNVNFPEITPPHERERQRAFLTAMGRRCCISLNLYRVDLDPCFAAELGAACGTSKTVRVGLAQPILDAGNEHLGAEHYRAAAAQIVRLAEASRRVGGHVTFDCGIPLCAFTDAQLGALLRCGTDFNFVCSPVVDISTGLDTWACFPFSGGTHLPLRDGRRLPDLHKLYREEWAGLRAAHRVDGVFAECSSCEHRSAQRCAGGCLAHALQLGAGPRPHAPVKTPRARPVTRAPAPPAAKRQRRR